MRITHPSLVLLAISAFLAAAPGCGGSGGGGGGGGGSAFAIGVTAQDLVAAPYRDDATQKDYLVLGDVLGRGQAVVPGLVVDSTGSINDVRWSPDHALLAVEADPDGVTGPVLFVVEPLTGATAQVSGPQATGTVVQRFEWSPDSRHLAFLRDTGKETPVFTVDADGANLVEVSGPIVLRGSVGDFEWSPDASHLALAMDADTDGTNEVYVVARNGSGRVKVSGTGAAAGSVVSQIDWSPDSTRVAFVGNLDATTVQELFVALASGVGGRTQVHPAFASGGNVLGRSQWAPNGSRLAYVADQTTDEVFELFTSLADGTGNVRVSGALVTGGDVDAIAFRWAPDSSRIAYVADQVTNAVLELFTGVPDGSSAAVKVSGAMVSGGNVGGTQLPLADGVAWSPDASRIAYVADEDVDGQEEIYVTLAASASPIRVSASAVSKGAAHAGPVWSGDSLHLTFAAAHVTASFDLFVSPRAGPAILLAPVATGSLDFVDGLGTPRDSLDGGHVVTRLVPGVAGNGDELHAFDVSTLVETVVITPPTPSVLGEIVAVR